MINFLLDKTLPDWVTKSFPIIEAVLLVCIALCAIVILIAVLVQPSNPDGGNNVITGKNESYFAANKGNTKEGRLNILIIALSITILVAAIIYFVLIGIYNGIGA